jgi:hypothetical protein
LHRYLEGIGFPTLDEKVDPARDAVLAARARIGEAVINDEFIVDCIGHELTRLELGQLAPGLVPFLVLPRTGIRVAFGYWPPSSGAGAHEHTAWTITAVCRNQLEVFTYDRLESYRRKALVAKHRFEAPAGRTGFIYEPCIHDPRNTSDAWSLSLHVTSPQDGRLTPGFEEPLACLRGPGDEPASAHPYMRVSTIRRQRRFVHQLAQILIASEAPDAAHALERCRRLGLPVTRRQIARRTGNDEVPHVLRRVDLSLELRARRVAGVAVLGCETERGLADELEVDELAYAAVARAAEQPELDIETLPGGLTPGERRELGDALESTGLFQRKWQ